MVNITLFSQILNKLDRNSFNKIVKLHSGDKHSKGINSWTHFVAMEFLHLARATSLREVSNGLLSISGNLVHLGILNKCPKKSSLSYINEHRNSKIFEDYFYSLFGKLSSECNFKQKTFKIKKKIYLLDSTLITLCSELFPWARYSKTKGAIKIHALLDYDGCLPKYVYISEGKVSDVRAAWAIDIPKNSVVVADRGYECFDLLNEWDEKGITFVVRIKKTTGKIGCGERVLSEDKDFEILIDEDVILENPQTRKKYPKKLRRVVIYDKKNDVKIELVTNNFTWTASTISKLYKCRWYIESFFKDLKTHLKIKTFVGTSANAVAIQIWTALIAILILKYLKAISKYGWCLSNLIAFLRMNLFVKLDLQYWLDSPFKPPGEEIEVIQYNIFD